MENCQHTTAEKVFCGGYSLLVTNRNTEVLPMKEVRVCEAMKSPVGTLSDGTVLHQQDGGTKSRQVPIWEKSNLTLEEAAAYSGIGINKLREMSDSKDCTFVLWNGTKRLLKRRRLDEHLDRLFSI